MTAQKENDQLTALLSTHFFSKDNPSMALAHMPPLLKTQLAHLASWWAGYFDEAGQLFNENGVDAPLSLNDDVGFYQPDYWPYVEYLDGDHQGATNLYNVTGTESYIEIPRRGLTLTGFFGLVNTGGAISHTFGKWGEASSRSYRIAMTPANQPIFQVTTDGINIVSVTSSVVIAEGDFYYVCGRFDPGAGLYITVNEVTDSNLVGVPASLYTSAFTGISIGREYSGGQESEMRMAWCSVHGAFHANQFVFQTREMSYNTFKS